MMNKTIRTRFAPSPTGGLHLGGVRTALYSYLFARKHQGQFVLRIEDTDQNRYVEGAEQYIIDCLEWCGIGADEGPHKIGPFGPYRQSERKEMYRQYALQLVESGHAYYAFDTPAELEAMRERLRSEKNPAPQYDHHTRMHMRNSLTLTESETRTLLDAHTPHVIRILMPANETIVFQDMIRGEIHHESSLVDDKVLLKADGMPTYHLAVVVDDYRMKITHAFRGEEWLPSAPVHMKLWEYLGWKNDMPQWAHLPLILKPDGHGKLSKRDGDRLGFPVFAMDWNDPKSGERTQGFRELGFLPEAFLNMLALLGWHSGTEQELFSREELIHHFSMERVHKGGARFDFEKARWFNHEWIKRIPEDKLLILLQDVFQKEGLVVAEEKLKRSMVLVKDRCTLLTDFIPQSMYLFRRPVQYDLDAIQLKWNSEKETFFTEWISGFHAVSDWNASMLEQNFKDLATQKGIKAGELQLPLRIMLVGAKHGIAVFQIAEMIGQSETTERIEETLQLLKR